MKGMTLDMTNTELTELYEYVVVQLGGEQVEVELTKKEIKILAKKAFKDYIEFIDNWQIRNQFGNIQGFNASTNFTNKYISENPMIAQRISDWFASQARIGGKTKWQRDYITLESGRQVYDLSQDSSVPYKAGTRRIHRVMWYAAPEIMGNQPDATLIDGGLVTFGYSGLMYGQNLMSYLGNSFDVVLLAQSLETRNKILRSEFFYNISGDKIELTPMPGSGYTGLPNGSKVFYYYFNEQDLLNLEGQEGPDGEENYNELISNPTQVKLDRVPFSKLNNPAKNWIENWTFGLSKYAFASKLRAIRKIASPDSDYQVEFDYNSLLEEYKSDKEALFLQLKEHLEQLDTEKIMEKKSAIIDSAKKQNALSPRKILVG